MVISPERGEKYAEVGNTNCNDSLSVTDCVYVSPVTPGRVNHSMPEYEGASWPP